MEAGAPLHQDPQHTMPPPSAGAVRAAESSGPGWVAFASAYLAIAGGMHVISGRTKTGDDEHVSPIAQQSRDDVAPRKRALLYGCGMRHQRHHFFFPIRRCPIRTAIC